MIIPNLTIDPAAEKFIRRMVRFSDHPEGGFRLTVTPGGCSGYSSEFTVEAAPREGDATINVNGVNLYLPAESRLMLEGITIGFEDTPTKSGLTFFNPNAASCACSSSGDSASAASTVSTVDISALRAH